MSISCPIGCSVAPPPVEANYCNPDVTNAQVTKLYITALDAVAFSDITDPAEWATRLSNTSLDPDAIRTLNVVGDKPAATATEVELGADKMATINKTHVLNLIVRETGDTNYNLLKTIECGANFKIAYALGKYLFSGDDGTGNTNNDLIEVNIKMNDQASNNYSDPYEFAITVTWKDKFHPFRQTNPIA